MCFAVSLCSDRLVQELEESPALFGAGGNRGRHAFVVALARLAAGSLRNATINNAVAHLLFGMVV
jgi:hypothetical protein